MYCSNCRNKLNGNEQFCGNCGNIVLIKKLTTSNNKKNKQNSKIIFIVIGILLCFGLGLGGLKIFKNTLKNEDKNNSIKKENENGFDILSQESTQFLLYKDYKNKVIDIDKYVEQLLYYVYDESLLDQKYKSNIKTYFKVDFMNLIEDNYNDLSENTIKYFLSKLVLEDLTFNLDEENEKEAISLVDYLIPTASADVKTTNLNKVYLSENKKFLIWYTTTGESKITEENVKNIAKIFENSSSEYDAMVGKDFTIDSVFLKKDERYKKQIEILKKNNIDEKYMEEALPIYLYNYGDNGSYAVYFNNKSFFYNLLYKAFDGEYDFSNISFPYILLQPAYYTENIDSLNQFLNHELFHHYQSQIINDDEVKSKFISEAVANWASASISKVNNSNGYLNDIVSQYLYSVDYFMGDYYEYNGDNMGYAFYPYLYHYENIVNNGKQKILDSMYEKDYLEYLEINSTYKEKISIMKDLALKNLTHEYTNKNLVANDESKYKLNPLAEINEDYKNSFAIQGFGQHYFKIDDLSHNWSFYIYCNERDTENQNLQVFLISEKDGIYTLKEHYDLESSIYLYSMYGESDNLYLVVSNPSLINNYSYQVEFSKEQENNREPEAEIEEDTSTIPNEKEFVTEFQNYNIKGSSSLTMNVSGMEINTEQIFEGTVDELHQKEYLKSSSKVMGMSVDTEIYTDFDNGVSYTKEPYSSEWIKDTGATQFIDLANILNKLKDNANVTLIAPNKYKVYFSKNDIKSLIATNSNVDTSAITGDIEGIVYTDNGYVTKIEYDFSDLVDTIQEYNMTLEFYNYNNAGEVELPADAVNNSKEY